MDYSWWSFMVTTYYSENLDFFNYFNNLPILIVALISDSYIANCALLNGYVSMCRIDANSKCVCPVS